MVSPLPADKVFANVNPFGKDDDEKAGSTQNTVNEASAATTKLVGPDTVTWRPSQDSDYKFESVSPSRSEDAARIGVSGNRTNGRSHAAMEKVKSAAQRFKLESFQTSGFSRLFNPTAVRMLVKYTNDSGDSSDDASQPEFALLWRSRDNRKGRNSVAVPISRTLTNERDLPASTATWTAMAKTIAQMFTTFPYWDMAFWCGWSYTIGSALFVIDGAFAWGPLRFPGGEFPGEAKYGVPLCFFFGAIFYQIGAVVAYLEAVNDGSFHGSAMRRLLEGHEEDHKKMVDEKIHHFFDHLVPHPHKQKEAEAAEALAYAVDPEAGWKTRDAADLRPGSIYPPDTGPAPRRGAVDLGGEEGETSTYVTWRWWPTWHALRTYHIYDIGYLACTIQLFGVTLYGITGIVVLPGILDSLNTWQTNAAYWIPQIVAAACFLVASLMFMLEAQDQWWKPTPRQLGWWIGAWSVVGSVGFELSAAFGPSSQDNTGAEYQSSLSSMWGSAAYLIGSFLQWYEAVDKNPVMQLDERKWRQGDERNFQSG